MLHNLDERRRLVSAALRQTRTAFSGVVGAVTNDGGFTLLRSYLGQPPSRRFSKSLRRHQIRSNIGQLKFLFSIVPRLVFINTLQASILVEFRDINSMPALAGGP